MDSNDSPNAVPVSQGFAPLLKALFSKDTLAWLCVLWNLFYGYAVKQTTTDRMQQQAQEDHVELTEIRKQLSVMQSQQAAVAARVEDLVGQTFKERH